MSARDGLAVSLQTLLPEIRALIASARRAASRAVDMLQVHTKFHIGRLIVEHEQGRQERAPYSAGLLSTVRGC